MHDEPQFRKSSFSPTDNCVEVAHHDGRMLVRDSKDQTGPVLTFNQTEWAAFLAGVHAGEFDR
jgi:hypothetical protein